MDIPTVGTNVGNESSVLSSSQKGFQQDKNSLQYGITTIVLQYFHHFRHDLRYKIGSSEIIIDICAP